MASSDATAGGDIDVAAMFRRLRAGWKTIIATVVVAIAVAVVYLNTAVYKYAVEMRVAPVVPANGDGLSSRLSSLGGLAAVAGVTLPDSGGSGSFKLYVESLHSRDVADILAHDKTIMHGVFAREWDARTKTWRQPGFVHNLATNIKGAIGIPSYPWAPPGPARLQQWMNEQVGVDQNLKTPVVTVALASDDPAFAAYFLDQLATTIDALLRQRALLRTDDYIRYLSSRLPTIVLAEQRVAIAQALGEQERIKMAASSDRAFAADIFEHPAASDRPVTPSPVKVLALALLFGVVAGLGITLLRRPRPPVPEP